MTKPRRRLIPGRTAPPPDQELTWDEVLAFIEDPPAHSVPRIITPGIAKRILNELNLNNRPMKPTYIKRYAADMSAGRWRVNSSALGFTNMHRLGDGQNRLQACVESGHPFPTHIIFGMADETFDTIDAGKSRSQGDMVTLHGARYGDDTASAVKWCEWFATGKVKSRPLFTPRETGVLFETHKSVDDFIPDARKIARANRLSVGMVAGHLYTVTKIDPALAAEFADAWMSGTRTPRFYGLTIMNTHLEKMRAAGATGGHRHEVLRAAMAVNCWNSARAGRTTGMAIKWDDGRLFPAFK